MVVYVGEELGPLTLFNVASSSITVPEVPLAIFVIFVLLPAEVDAPIFPVNLNRQLAEVVLSVTLASYTNFFTPGQGFVSDEHLVLFICEGQTGVTSTTFVGLCPVSVSVVYVLDPLKTITCAVAVDNAGKALPAQSP